jgi:hypothetical protein
MEALIVALTTSLFTALSFLAYKHPRPFARIANILNLAGLVTYGAITIAYCAGLYMKTEIYGGVYQADAFDFKTKVAIGDIINKVWSNNLPPMGWIFLGYVIWSAYLFILSRLPSILELDKGANSNSTE